MKISEFKALIKEEVKKAINEAGTSKIIIPATPKDNDPNQVYVIPGLIGYFKIKNNKWEQIGLRKPAGVSDKDVIIIKESN